MKTLFLLIISSLVATRQARAQSDIVINLPKAEFTGSATFETLNQDTFVPVSKTRLSSDRSTTLDEFKWDTPYTIVDNGFPGGASGVRTGGLSIEDTQVSTLGIPLNAPEGFGANFAFFPTYLWDSMSTSPTTSSSGFAPGASAGRVEFSPWTRSQIIDRRFNRSPSRATVSYDHDSQTYSLATKQDSYAILLGASTGLMDGVSGEASANLFEEKTGHIFFHIIGTNETANSPGSTLFPTPLATLQNWRVMPVLETAFHLENQFDVESTAFADLNSLTYLNPSGTTPNSSTRTNQFGLENALTHGVDTLALSARYVTYMGATSGELNDVPLYSGLTHEFFLSEENSLKTTLNGTYENNEGVAPGGKASFKFSSSEKTYPFAELNTVAKLPTLADRYATFGTYHGNPDLKPERVYSVLGGYRFEQNHFLSQSILKAEYRLGIQVSNANYTTTINGGNAYLLSFTEEAGTPIFYWLDCKFTMLFTYSKLQASSFSYPDLPYVTLTAGLIAHPLDAFQIGVDSRLVGTSTSYGGAAHPGYALFEGNVGYQISKDAHVKAGVDNILNSDGQAVLDYPLEGRRFFASLNASF